MLVIDVNVFYHDFDGTSEFPVLDRLVHLFGGWEPANAKLKQRGARGITLVLDWNQARP